MNIGRDGALLSAPTLLNNKFRHGNNNLSTVRRPTLEVPNFRMHAAVLKQQCLFVLSKANEIEDVYILYNTKNRLFQTIPYPI